MEIKIISVKDIMRCPMAIFLPSHYRANGTCRCDEPLCEEKDCKREKFRKEIFCKAHLDEHFGPDGFNEEDD